MTGDCDRMLYLISTSGITHCTCTRLTAHALISLLQEWTETLDAGGSVRTMSVDFRKAFDHIDHNLRICKLLPYDTLHCLIRWFIPTRVIEGSESVYGFVRVEVCLKARD